MEQLVQTFVDAVSVGSLYALTALGIGLIFGVMRLINFAHGELITFAAYALLALFGLPVPVMLFGAMLVAVALALITERAAFRPLRNADPTTLLISSFAVSFFLQKLLILVVGSRLERPRFSPGARPADRGDGRSPAAPPDRDHPGQRRTPRGADLVSALDAARLADARRGGGFPHGAGAGRPRQPRDRGGLCAAAAFSPPPSPA